MLGATLLAASAFILLALLSEVQEAAALLKFSASTVPITPFGEWSTRVGRILFGIATIRAGVLPCGAGMLLCGGVVLVILGSLGLMLLGATGTAPAAGGQRCVSPAILGVISQ